MPKLSKIIKPYQIQVPIKSYLKQWLHAQYGSPYVITRYDYFGRIIQSYFDTKFYYRQHHELLHKSFDKFDDFIEIQPMHKGLLYEKYGDDLPAQNVISINALIEAAFDEDLTKYCVWSDDLLLNNLENFCLSNGIVINTHISVEVLIKKVYRSKCKMTYLSASTIPKIIRHTHNYANTAQIRWADIK